MVPLEVGRGHQTPWNWTCRGLQVSNIHFVVSQGNDSLYCINITDHLWQLSFRYKGNHAVCHRPLNLGSVVQYPVGWATGYSGALCPLFFFYADRSEKIGTDKLGTMRNYSYQLNKKIVIFSSDRDTTLS